MERDEKAAGPAAGAGTVDQEFVDGATRRRLHRTVGAAGALVLALLTLTYGAYFARFAGQGPGDQGAWGQFGDFVGGTLNSLVGLATLLVLACTVVLQMRQLELTRQAMADAQHEMRQADAERRDAAAAAALQIEAAQRTAAAQKQAADHQLVTARVQALIALHAAYTQPDITAGGLIMDGNARMRAVAAIVTEIAALHDTLRDDPLFTREAASRRRPASTEEPAA